MAAVQIFICGDGGAAVECMTPSCMNKAPHRCGYPTRTRAGVASECGAAVCDSCRKMFGDLTLCPPHARLTEKRSETALGLERR